jgi:hypothetical protein
VLDSVLGATCQSLPLLQVRGLTNSARTTMGRHIFHGFTATTTIGERVIDAAAALGAWIGVSRR